MSLSMCQYPVPKLLDVFFLGDNTSCLPLSINKWVLHPKIGFCSSDTYQNITFASAQI
jgi:hypothetical protein